MKLVLVTGAGASRNLARDGQTMPLMREWSESLCEALDASEAGLADACRLKRGASGPEFEENLGLLLRFQDLQPLAARFIDLGGSLVPSRMTAAKEAHDNTARRLSIVMDVLNTTLYDLFGLDQVDDGRAKSAFEELLAEFGQPELVVATTNYDRSVESALEHLGHTVTTGARSTRSRTPILETADLFENRGPGTLVLHLHGAVGWYEKDGEVRDYYGDQSYSASHGRPVVLYPDPSKEPTRDALVADLWTAFRKALEWSDHVLVLGHSLNDPTLVAELHSVQGQTKIIVTYIELALRGEIHTKLPNARAASLEFRPHPRFDDHEWNAWKGP